ncbi:MAG: gamma-glutamylcyclotransferase [Chloroherpetonaceae bacterium]|nr:gamma-glutamylcyclotransferase [Chloroherpetonaceae bacterium]MCS7210617.1 gamma-glutamylcyclotransferase [Chloroherpetonaceae bacterium]MDW8020475.1 gamma-glutamylcyclotransferase [Chloroherpetonaceae bacterium]MDW8465346.1 gamma-glutamylcyclotransferase [Chloroherpetonaceae bacterium]
MKLFVYGTLRRGLERHWLLQNSSYLGDGTIRARLYDLGDYPGIKKGNGTVYGELYEVDAPTLARLDEEEDYMPSCESQSLYLRRWVTVRDRNGKRQRAFAYFYNGTVCESRRIVHGDYCRYRHEKMLSSQS